MSIRLDLMRQGGTVFLLSGVLPASAPPGVQSFCAKRGGFPQHDAKSTTHPKVDEQCAETLEILGR